MNNYMEKLYKRGIHDENLLNSLKIEEDKGLLKTKFVMTGQGQTLSDEASDYSYVRQGNVCISGICVEPVSDLLVDDLTFKL